MVISGGIMLTDGHRPLIVTFMGTTTSRTYVTGEHTPGPWVWESLPGRRGNYRRTLLGGSPRVKVLSQDPDIIGAYEVDEKLIAAAPDLLAALILCRDQLVSVGQELGELSLASDVDALNAADAAIAKATEQ